MHHITCGWLSALQEWHTQRGAGWLAAPAKALRKPPPPAPATGWATCMPRPPGRPKGEEAGFLVLQAPHLMPKLGLMKVHALHSQGPASTPGGGVFGTPMPIPGRGRKLSGPGIKASASLWGSGGRSRGSSGAPPAPLAPAAAASLKLPHTVHCTSKKGFW